MDFSNIFSTGVNSLVDKKKDGNILDTILGMVGSKGGQTLVNAAGAGMQAYGQGKQAEADRALNAHQFDANMAQRQLEGDRSHQLDTATSAAAASPMGEAQNYAQRNALMSAILGNARNFNVTPGDPAVAGAMGKSTGGLQLPTNGLDPEMLNRLFGDEATQASIAQRQKAVGQINPRAPVMDLSTLYGHSADGSENAFTSDVKGSNAQELQRQMDESAKQRAIIQAAIDEDVNHTKTQQQGKSGGSRAGGALRGAASGAMTGASLGSFVPGIGTAIGGAVGGIGGFLKGLF